MYERHKIVIIIPAVNEEASIAKVIKAIPPDVADRVIVVDNGSVDRTKEVADQCGADVLTEACKGYGSACLKGLSAINNADIVVFLDGDYSDYPEQIMRLLDPIVADKADFVLGSRVLGHREKGSLLAQAYWGNKLTTFLIKLFTGFSFSDMGPMRAIRFQCIESFEMKDKNFGWNVEMQMKAVKQGLRIQEVPVDYRKRIGKSKISGTISGTIKAGVKIIYSVFKYALVG